MACWVFCGFPACLAQRRRPDRCGICATASHMCWGTGFCGCCWWCTPVSYTHLDVYKRQLVNSVTANLPLVSSTDFIPLLDIQYNVPVGTVLFMMGGSGALTQWQSGVYTLVLALVYSVCAALLFRVRRSEAAGQSAPNRVLQAVYRLVLSMVCLLYTSP